MNVVTKQLVMVIGPMVLKNVLDSILQEEKLVEYRDRLIAAVRAKTSATKNTIDDAVVEGVIKSIMEPGKFIELTMTVVSLARQYITHTESPLDDKLLLPILDRIEVIGIGKAA